MKTIAQQLNIKDFPFEIRDKNGNRIYVEASNGYWLKRECDSNGNITYMEASNGDWVKKEYDSNGNRIYVEDSEGKIIDNRPKSTCEGRIVEIDGKKYELKEVK
jgi:hypothetical protein